MSARGGLALDPEWAEYQRWKAEETTYVVAQAASADAPDVAASGKDGTR